MWLGFLLAVGAGVLWSAIGVLNSKVARRNLDYASYAGAGVLVGAAVAWAFLPRYRIAIEWPPYSWHITATCIVAAIISGLGYVTLQRALLSGHHGAVWTVAQSAMAMPLLTAMIGWGEPLSLAGAVGMGLLFFSLILIGLGNQRKPESAEKPGTSWFWYAVMTLVLFGLSQSLNSVPSLQQWPDPAQLRTPLYSVGQCIFYATLMWLRGSRFHRAETLLGLRYAIYGTVSMVMMYHAMDLLASHRAGGMTLPVGVGTCIVGFALYSVLWLREKAGILILIGIGLAIAGVGSLILRGLGW